MSISIAAEPQSETDSGGVTALAAAARRLLVACIAWRAERAAIALLRAMSDRDLSDMGLSRSEIASAVQGAGSARHALQRPE